MIDTSLTEMVVSEKFEDTFSNVMKLLCKFKQYQIYVQGDQDHFYAKEMLISPSILKLHKNP